MLQNEFEASAFPTTLIWNFSSYRPVYDRSVPEVVYTKKWQRLMVPKRITGFVSVADGKIEVDSHDVLEGDIQFPICDVLPAVTLPTEHQTRIASSFIHWLGCRSGRDFLQAAKWLIRENGLSVKHAYIVQWDKENTRRSMVNDRFVPRDLLTSVPFNERRRAASVEDIEILEQTVRWAAGEGGQAFIKSCEDNIALKQAREWAARRVHFDVGAPGVSPK